MSRADAFDHQEAYRSEREMPSIPRSNVWRSIWSAGSGLPRDRYLYR